MSKSDQLLHVLFGVTVFLLPFNDSPWLRGVLREMASELAFYPLVLFSVLFLIVKRTLVLEESKKMIREPTGVMIVMFLGWIAISGLANFPEILNNYSHGRTGVLKFVAQAGMLVAWFGVTWLVAIYVRSDEKIWTALGWGVIAASGVIVAVALVELLDWSGVGWAVAGMDWFNEHYHYAKAIRELERLRTVSSEPGWLMRVLVYYQVFWGLVLVWKWTSPRLNLLLLVNVILLVVAYLTYSRTLVYAVFLIPMGLLLSVLIFGKRRHIAFAAGSIVLLGAAGYGIASKDTILSSRITFATPTEGDPRYIAAKAGASMLGESPVFGVGIGQNGFFFREHLSEQGGLHGEIASRLKDDAGSYFYGLASLHVRVAAEMGLPGLAVFWLIHGLVIYQLYSYSGRQFGQDAKLLMLGMILIVLCSLLNYIATESARYVQYWIALGLAWGVARKYRDHSSS